MKTFFSKDPSSAIPKGTLLAIGTTSMSYVIFSFLAGASVLRDATGNTTDYINLTTLQDYYDVCTNAVEPCEKGSHHDFQVAKNFHHMIFLSVSKSYYVSDEERCSCFFVFFILLVILPVLNP